MKETDVPNMITEVFEAIHEYFKEDPDIEADCYVYLGNLGIVEARKISTKCTVALENMNRCPECGSSLESYSYKEPHPELDGCPAETLTIMYCPNCGEV